VRRRRAKRSFCIFFSAGSLVSFPRNDNVVSDLREKVEEHMEARKNPAFPDLVAPIRALTIPAPEKKTVFHVKFHENK
jgi:hypothetical protein